MSKGTELSLPCGPEESSIKSTLGKSPTECLPFRPLLPVDSVPLSSTGRSIGLGLRAGAVGVVCDWGRTSGSSWSTTLRRVEEKGTVFLEVFLSFYLLVDVEGFGSPRDLSFTLLRITLSRLVYKQHNGIKE